MNRDDMKVFYANFKVVYLFLLLLIANKSVEFHAAVISPESKLTAENRLPFGQEGKSAHYHLKSDSTGVATMVDAYTLSLGSIELDKGKNLHQWLMLDLIKTDGGRFRVWILSSEYPKRNIGIAQKNIARYMVQKGESEPIEYVDRFSGQAVLPSLGGWEHLLPRDEDPESSVADGIFPPSTVLLGHRYSRVSLDSLPPLATPTRIKIVPLLPDIMIGVPSNVRTKDNMRRYDDSDYEMVRLNRENYMEMISAGINCFRVDAEQMSWVMEHPVFYWGVGGKNLNFPECLYYSNYLGPEQFLDEPAVGTRDHVIRPRLAKDSDYRRNITPQLVFNEFCEYFGKTINGRAPNSLMQGLRECPDIRLGEMQFPQANLFSWETMISTAAYQLTQDNHVPAAIVFEPPGRIGARRTLPEMNMTYGCQIPTDDPKNFAGIIYGFLRGAARLTDKSWGVSIYGSVDQAEAPWFLSHAYDLGATRFFFWDNYRSACVPYQECLNLARHLRTHTESNPHRQMQSLLRAAEIAILLPPGYNLGHVHMG